MQPRFQNKSKLPAREQNIPDQSTQSNTVYSIQSGAGGGGINFLPLKRGFIREGGLFERGGLIKNLRHLS